MFKGIKNIYKMEDKKHQARNNYSSSTFLNRNNLDGFQNVDEEFKENFEKISNSNPCKKYSESQKYNNHNLSLEQFMKNQNKKHLTTKFGHKDVAIFLKEKDKALQEIIINEEINESENSENKNDIKDENNSNKSSHNLIFHGTFGKDQYNRIMNKEHHHHHHRHHHHHHHHKDNLETGQLSFNNKERNKEGNNPMKC